MKRIGKNVFYLLSLVLSLMLAPSAWAGTMTGELDKVEGTVDDQFVYTLSIQGSADGDPAFPPLDGIEVREAGKGQSISIVNGKMSRELQIRFVLMPKKAGSFTIPSIVLKIDGKNEQTLPIEFKVAEADVAPSGEGAPVFIERVFSKTKAYVGETIGVRIKVFTSGAIKIVGATPEFTYPKGFQIQNIEGQKSYTQMVQGQEYSVTELQAVITPQVEGHFSVDPAVLHTKIAVARRGRQRGFFDDLLSPMDVTEKRFRSPAAELEVLPLPLTGRRRDFSGLVGTFTANASLSPEQIRTGETANLDLEIKGVGSTAGMADPQIPADKRFKVYKDKPRSEEVLDASKGILSSRRFKYALVPNEPGAIDLGQLSLQVFNPETGAYEDLTIPLGRLEAQGAPLPAAVAPVSPAAASAPADSSDTAAEAPAAPLPAPREDLIAPYPTNALDSVSTLQPWEYAFSLALLFLAAGAAFISFWYRHQAQADVKLRLKAAKAFRHSKRTLDQAQSMLDRHDIQAAIALAQSSFRTYIGDKFAVPSASITLKDVEGQLSRHGLDGETLYEVRDLWQGLDQLLYAAPLALNPDRGRQLLQRMKSVLEKVEHRC